MGDKWHAHIHSSVLTPPFWIRWIVTDFTCVGGLGGAQGPGQSCARPFFAKNWYSSGPTKKSYYKFASRYCNNASYPAQSDWIHLCQEEPAIPSYLPCDRVTFDDTSDTPDVPVDFWGKVKICWTDQGEPEVLKKYVQ